MGAHLFGYVLDVCCGIIAFCLHMAQQASCNSQKQMQIMFLLAYIFKSKPYPLNPTHCMQKFIIAGKPAVAKQELSQ
jgi:hypothetical protein